MATRPTTFPDHARRRGNGTAPPSVRPEAGRTGAHLRAVHGLATRLNRLNESAEIGEAIAAELRELVDYHNCRVYLLHPDEDLLVPVAFQGDVDVDEEHRVEALSVRVGEGITGWVAQTGETRLTGNAAHDPVAVDIPGTPDVEESILAVPMRFGDRVIGAIVLSQLGLDRFDEHDARLLEVMASVAAVAFENARLFRVEREAAQTARELLKLSQALTRAGDADAVLDVAFTAVPALLGTGRMAAWITDPVGGGLQLARHRGFHPALAAGWHGDAFGDVLAILLGADGPVLLTPGPRGSVPRWIAGEDESVLIAPMRWEPGGRGALVMVAAAGAAFGPLDVPLAGGIADMTSLALANARRYQQLEEAYVSTIEALANALEAKDENTSDHARSLARMTLAVGAEIGLTGDRLKRLELAALFHDIGKIGVPSEIIRKPGPLTPQERREMQRHPEIGAQILAPVPFLQPIRPIVRACHERWDGHGYPDGLAGRAIPLEARVIFVCDAFDAMVTNRPYRKALSHREAVRRLKLSAGTQFDPKIVAAFLRVHERGELDRGHPEADGPAVGGSRTG